MFDVTGLSRGSTVVSTSARPLRETLPEQLVRLSRLDGSAVAITGLDAWCAGLGDALSGQRDSDRFDAPLLESYLGLGRILAKGFVAIELDGGPGRLRIGHEQLEAMARMLASVPRPRQVKIMGMLEPLDPGGRRFTLILPSTSVSGLLDEGVPSERLAEWSGQRVVASGLAVFRPSGALLRLEAQRLEARRERNDERSDTRCARIVFAQSRLDLRGDLRSVNPCRLHDDTTASNPLDDQLRGHRRAPYRRGRRRSKLRNGSLRKGSAAECRPSGWPLARRRPMCCDPVSLGVRPAPP